MAVQSLVHPTPETLAAFNRGALTAGERAGVEEHVSGCDSCCSALAVLSEDRLVGLARKAGAALPPTADMIDVPDVPPELIDHPRYHVLSQLGAGGMGVVYKAEHRLMGRIVALKVVARRYTSNPAAVERFRREFRAAARLNHPNIVTAHDADEANGLHFLVMEYVEGISLDRLVRKKGPLPVATACQCIRQAALGLQHAFEAKMVHRDIKPHNLMVTRKGQVKVLDFGLARVAAETDLPALPGGTDHSDRTVTSASTVMGTPDYLAPEQARNSHTVDIRADIYALGCVFYFLLTGRAPFAKLSGALEKMLAHTQDEPESIRNFRNDIPVEVVKLVERMMAKNPDQRFATPGEVATELKPFTRAEAIIDEQPDIIDSPTAPMVEIPTTPVAQAPTMNVPRVRLRRKKFARKRARNRFPLFIGGGVAASLLITVGLIVGLSGNGKDRTTEPTPPSPGVSKSGTQVAASKKRVLFMAQSKELHYRDFFPVKARLEAGGLEVVTASTQKSEFCQIDTYGTYGGKERVKPDLTIDEIDPAKFDGVIFCGADVTEFVGWPRPEAFAPIQRLVTEMSKQGKVVAAICTGQKVLWELDSLRGRKAAVPALSRLTETDSKLKEITPVYQQKVVTDGNFITASGPDNAVPFADAIIAAIKKGS